MEFLPKSTCRKGKRASDTMLSGGMSFGHARDFMRLMSQASLHFMKKTTLETCLANMPEHSGKNLQGKQSESSNVPDYFLICIKGTTQDTCLVLSLIISLIFHPEFPERTPHVLRTNSAHTPLVRQRSVEESTNYRRQKTGLSDLNTKVLQCHGIQLGIKATFNLKPYFLLDQNL